MFQLGTAQRKDPNQVAIADNASAAQQQTAMPLATTAAASAAKRTSAPTAFKGWQPEAAAPQQAKTQPTSPFGSFGAKPAATAQPTAAAPTAATPKAAAKNPLGDFISNLNSQADAIRQNLTDMFSGGWRQNTQPKPAGDTPAPAPATPAPAGDTPATPPSIKRPKIGDKTSLGTYGNTNSKQAAVGDATLGTPEDPEHIQTSGDNVGASRLHATANIGYVRPDDPVDPPVPAGPSSPNTGTGGSGGAAGGAGGAGGFDLGGFLGSLGGLMGGAGGMPGMPGSLGGSNGGGAPWLPGGAPTGVMNGGSGTGGSQGMGGPDTWLPGGAPTGTGTQPGDFTSYFPGGNLSVNPDGSVNGAGPNLTGGVAAGAGIKKPSIAKKNIDGSGGLISQTWDPTSGYNHAAYTKDGRTIWFTTAEAADNYNADRWAGEQADQAAKDKRTVDAQDAASNAAMSGVRAMQTAQNASNAANAQARMDGSAYPSAPPKTTTASSQPATKPGYTAEGHPTSAAPSSTATAGASWGGADTNNLYPSEQGHYVANDPNNKNAGITFVYNQTQYQNTGGQKYTAPTQPSTPQQPSTPPSVQTSYVPPKPTIAKKIDWSAREKVLA